jgi:hypothetical protein
MSEDRMHLPLVTAKQEQPPAIFRQMMICDPPILVEVRLLHLLEMVDKKLHRVRNNFVAN